MADDALPEPVLSERFMGAMTFAYDAHSSQSRKGTEIPYIAHVLGVTSLVLENGGSEDQAIAALLHDAAEDGGGEKVLARIRRRFGEHVAELVDALSDSLEEDPEKKLPWEERKAKYIAELAQESSEVALISAADKLHNLRSILDDLERHGEQLWQRFKGGKDGSLWYYREIIDALTTVQRRDHDHGLAWLLAHLEQTYGEVLALSID